MKRKGAFDDSEFEKEIAEAVKMYGYGGKPTGTPEERAKVINAALSGIKFGEDNVKKKK